MMNILIVLLGCNIVSLLYDRIHAALDISYLYRNDQVDWFLSGGIKDPMTDIISEARKMQQIISQPYLNETATETATRISAWNYIYDTKSQNTAENFVMVKKYLETNDTAYGRMYIVTSHFHYKRANQFQRQVLPNIDFEWILSPLELEDSELWENIHITNVESDVKQAFRKYQIVM
jgi:uncharacterized SAM-binding protein YcdF (DUF218 family)